MKTSRPRRTGLAPACTDAAAGKTTPLSELAKAAAGGWRALMPAASSALPSGLDAPQRSARLTHAPFAKIDFGQMPRFSLPENWSSEQLAALLAAARGGALARVFQAPDSHPDRDRLASVKDFFAYTQEEDKRFFAELDRDGDGRVRLDDLRAAARRRNLPERYAADFMARARRAWFRDWVTPDEVRSVMDEKEATMLRAFTSLEVNARGALAGVQLRAALRRAALPAGDATVAAMMRHLSSGPDGAVTYGQFRSFAALLPPERLGGADPSATAWFESATALPVAASRHPGVDNGASVVLLSALAGAVTSGATTAVMHPLDTVKTRIQASSLPAWDVLRSVPRLGTRALYRGITPACVGAAAMHGARTGAYEATMLLLQPLLALGLPGLAEPQLRGLASGVGTALGTGMRIPCEVLKQRLQAGSFTDVGAALSAALKTDGVRGLFRGTAATLGREVPFYVLGMWSYETLKVAAAHWHQAAGGAPDLANWERLVIGALSGAIAAVATTPADVLKTRMMIGAGTAGSGSAWTVAQAIVRAEGVGVLFRGALPRGLWIAPLGAMNFAGYELAKRALLEQQQRQGSKGVSDSAGAVETAAAEP